MSLTPQISYSITVCNEATEIRRLLTFLARTARRIDEIVVLFDTSRKSDAVRAVLEEFAKNSGPVPFRFEEGVFDGHFGNWKNRLIDLCRGEWMFNLDADELPTEKLIRWLPFLTGVPLVELYSIPRLNTVEGLTKDDISAWKWKVNRKGWVNWPDHQRRLFRNRPHIRWQGHLHESVVGSKVDIALPAQIIGPSIALQHPKVVDRQRTQYAFYDTLKT